LPEAFGTADFIVRWTGSDDPGGSGVAAYDLYVSRDDGPYQHVVTTAETSYTFTGESGSTYGFATRARDQVGNIEPMPTSPDAETLVIIGAWVNRDNLYDVNAKDGVTAIDALMVINELWRKRVFDPETSILTPLPPDGYAPPYYDVTDDGKLTSLDALRVVNYLYRQSIGQGEQTAWLPEIVSADPHLIGRDATRYAFRATPTPVAIGDAAVNGTSLTRHPSPVQAVNRMVASESAWFDAADEGARLEDVDHTLDTLADDVARQWALLP
jgi:hypothetical protein